jgi:hypothetical protein
MARPSDASGIGDASAPQPGDIDRSLPHGCGAIAPRQAMRIKVSRNQLVRRLVNLPPMAPRATSFDSWRPSVAFDAALWALTFVALWQIFLS